MLEVENIDGDPDVREYFVKRSRRLRRYLARVIRTGQQRGEIRDDIDANLKASEIIAFIEGAQLMRFQDPPRMRLVELYDKYTRSLVRDLTSHRDIRHARRTEKRRRPAAR